MEFYARQGEVTIIRIPDGPLPSWPELGLQGGHLIVGPSETHHHHVIERPSAVRIVAKPGSGAMTVLRMIVKEPTRVIHLRGHDTHRPVDLPPGSYEIRGQQEYDPYAEAVRRAAD
ncbi:hypothetical protein CG51_06045 [Haematobacter missouriensis]|uniref:Uncharacterized protein n=1 Tax=Haematobacter missouriensis TaxID=366616 RepID=A0A212APY5_9RHOB|nr:hypothetical protein [Haematobacter missouriensis]KFI30980.1 hypothetical protein CG51_06045 [Haematobacter missouriensis]OWJ73913.1 hypothetical protein CDV53_14385 [Haematobacter missouriensis]OWJ83551.1 hypothetical protein CDV52_11030 [Haematobacter missouriensis]